MRPPSWVRCNYALIMILILGGKSSGKLDYIKNELGYAESCISQDPTDEKQVMYGLERYLRTEKSVSMEQLCKKRIVSCDEVGSGVVPVSEEEREYRERVGRACCEIAKHADRVIRMVCGIPQIIKG
ncbi:MAG: bifunctional adenosylcobinamide kinase/adenosylcobinamide-phosphate guanylyltransferase [Oscillospiraceae bacterium]